MSGQIDLEDKTRIPERIRRADYSFRITANRKAQSDRCLTAKRIPEEARQLLNIALEGLLQHFGHPFGVIIEGLDIDSDPVELFQTAPGIIDVLEAAGHLKKGTLSERSAGWLAGLIDDLVNTFVESDAGDEFAKKRIEVIAKLLDPETYGGGIPLTVVEELLEKFHTPPALARGLALRDLMRRLSWGVEPNKPGQSVLEGNVRLTDSKFLKRETTFWHEYGEWKTAYEVALEHWPKRGAPTLKSLAVKVYLKQLQKEGFTTISEASLAGDLQELAEWDKTQEPLRRWILIFNAGGKNIRLPWQDYSEGWKHSRHYEQNKPPEKAKPKTKIKTRGRKGG